jgi:hypothetical protein
MRAFVAQVDHTGLWRLTPEDLIPGDELRRMALRRSPRPDSIVWALLEDGDAEALRADLDAGRYGAACGLLLNRAVELISLGAAAPGPAPTAP